MSDLTRAAEAITGWLSLFPGPLLPTLLVWLALRKRRTLLEILFMASVIHLLVFTLAVVVPFYFHGYADLYPDRPPRALGWTNYPIIGDFAYVYTFPLYAWLWLLFGILAAAFGRSQTSPRLDIALRAAVIAALAWYLVEVRRFEVTINSILE